MRSRRADRAERRELPAHDLAGVAGERVPATEAPEHPPDDRQQHEDERQADEQELEEARSTGPARSRKPANWRVRRRADLGADAAEVRAVGDRQHDRHAVVREARAASRASSWAMSATPIGIIIVAVAVFDDPERDEGGRREDAGEQPARIGADALHDAEGEPAVEVPLLHRRRDRHAAGEEEDVGIEVGRGEAREAGRDGPSPKTPSSGKSDERHAGGPVDRQRLGQPPDRHQRRDRRRPRRAGADLALMVERRVEQEHARREREAERRAPTVARRGARWPSESPLRLQRKWSVSSTRRRAARGRRAPSS